MDSYKDLTETLDSIGFRYFYSESIQTSKVEVNFGTRIGIKNFSSIKSAAELYTYNSAGKYMVNIDHQLADIRLIDDNELILQCIEVFDWGGVQASNVISAINLHRNHLLKQYLNECKAWFECDDTLNLDLDKILWSSGWTKVFSFMFNLTTIYDSRVAAYINYIIVDFYNSLDTFEDKSALKSITRHLVSFKGTGTRTRCLNSEYRGLLDIKMKGSKGENNFRANKVASWLIRYFSQLEYGHITQKNFRQIDKAMFMLGFDISQIENNAPFE